MNQPLLKPDWDRLTVHVRRRRKELLTELLGHGQVSPWVNALIDAALPALVTARAARQRAIAAAVAAVEQVSAPPRRKGGRK